ncbi:unnamed protein product, partial [Phaeothamnion confervicola]
TSGSCASNDPNYDYSVVLLGANTIAMAWKVNDANGTVSVKLTYNGDGWVGWGPSPNGNMIGSDAVIGLPDDGVYEYHLYAKELSAVKKYPQQELTDASVVQSNGVTTVKFTRPLQPAAGKLPMPVSADFMSVFAHGAINALSEHPANAMGAATLSF